MRNFKALVAHSWCCWHAHLEKNPLVSLVHFFQGTSGTLLSKVIKRELLTSELSFGHLLCPNGIMCTLCIVRMFGKWLNLESATKLPVYWEVESWVSTQDREEAREGRRVAGWDLSVIINVIELNLPSGEGLLKLAREVSSLLNNTGSK